MAERTWRFWTVSSILLLLFIGATLAINVIWFKPFSIRLFFDRVMVLGVMDSPETITSMSIPVLYGLTKSDLDDASDAAMVENYQETRDNYDTLMSYDFDSLSPEDQLNSKIFAWNLKSALDGERFRHHGYPINQMFGVQNSLPGLLERSHKLEDESDVQAYIARLKKFRIKFEQVLDGLKIRESKGIVPPGFIITRVLEEMRGFVSGVETNILYTNFVTKVALIDSLNDAEKAAYTEEVRAVVADDVFSAYQLLIDYFEHLDSVATNDAGVWKFPDGDEYYRYRMRMMTTTDLEPEEVHQIGLEEVARIEKEMWQILESEGYENTGEPLGVVMQRVFAEERFQYPDEDASRDLILADYKRIIDEISEGLDDAFDVRPKAGIEVRRVPAFREAGASGGSYMRPAVDGSRGGIFYANLRDVRETVKPDMKTLAYHEGVPGHHFQIAIQAELEDVPIFRTVGFFTAFIEGWALYAERVAWELGFYEGDPYGNLGRLKAEMFRAVRLVVDTGLHSKRWTREQAIDYMVANTGMARSEVVTQIERYVVLPGQALAYKIGMMKILELREKARAALGDRFDVRDFHNVVLKNGAVPLEILEEIIDTYIAETSVQAAA